MDWSEIRKGQFENDLLFGLICTFSSFSGSLLWILFFKSTAKLIMLAHTHTYTPHHYTEHSSYHFLRETHRFIWDKSWRQGFLWQQTSLTKEKQCCLHRYWPTRGDALLFCNRYSETTVVLPSPAPGWAALQVVRRANAEALFSWQYKSISTACFLPAAHFLT